jgi:hypothetical protein
MDGEKLDTGQAMVKRRYSIWGTEWGADHEVELAQVDSNPQPVLDGLSMKMLTIKHSIFEKTKRKQTKVRKYSWLRIVENKNHEA